MTCARNLFIFQKRETIDDGAGGREEAWIDVCKSFGTPKWVRGVERTASSDGDAVAALETWLVTIPYIDGITTDMRVVWKKVNYNIRSSADREQNRRNLIVEIESGVAD